MKDHDQIPQLNQHLNSLFGKFGFSKLTEIQKKASSIILQKKDCLVIAPTGSGKIKTLHITPLRALNHDEFQVLINFNEHIL